MCCYSTSLSTPTFKKTKTFQIMCSNTLGQINSYGAHLCCSSNLLKIQFSCVQHHVFIWCLYKRWPFSLELWGCCLAGNLLATFAFKKKQPTLEFQLTHLRGLLFTSGAANKMVQHQPGGGGGEGVICCFFCVYRQQLTNFPVRHSKELHQDSGLQRSAQRCLTSVV